MTDEHPKDFVIIFDRYPPGKLPSYDAYKAKLSKSIPGWTLAIKIFGREEFMVLARLDASSPSWRANLAGVLPTYTEVFVLSREPWHIAPATAQTLVAERNMTAAYVFVSCGASGPCQALADRIRSRLKTGLLLGVARLEPFSRFHVIIGLADVDPAALDHDIDDLTAELSISEAEVVIGVKHGWNASGGESKHEELLRAAEDFQSDQTILLGKTYGVG
jgi:hypothetical protein